MLEKRCPKCNHLFFKVENHQQWCKSLKIHVKCSKCKEIFEVVHHEGDDYDVKPSKFEIVEKDGEKFVKLTTK